MRNRVLWIGMMTVLSGAIASAMALNMITSARSPVNVGSMVRFTATATDSGVGNLWYRFRVRRAGGEFELIRDFGPSNTLDWTAADHEGFYQMEVYARNVDAGYVAEAIVPFQFQSLVIDQQPVVTPTSNSLVFLYSAPACPAGMRMRVEFAQGELPLARAARRDAAAVPASSPQYTPYVNCRAGLSMNFYLAGLQAKSDYTARYMIDTGSAIGSGPALAFTTGSVPGGLYTDVIQKQAPVNASDPILLGSPLGLPPVANDLAGNVVWYGPGDISLVTRPTAGGDIWGLVELANADPSQQVIRKFDLAGMTLLETNAGRVNEQLKALGKRQITGFHHEARALPGGRVVTLAGVEQILTDVQGPGPVDVLGDMIIVLDKDMNVVWTWDTFDNLDAHRAAILGELCPSACPPTQLSKTANDWTHGNAVQLTPDGNLLYSARHQDWLIKINYDGGTGDGHILWKLGKDGDFQITSNDPYPWFSHQHDGNIESADPTKLLVFDDGNTRVAEMNGGNSRGQVLQLNEKNLTVTPVLNADLGVYAAAVGSAERLRDGNYHFDAGFVQENNTIDSYSYEVEPSGQIDYIAHQNAILYRTFRMTDMYTPN
jgi:arylsulfate sulfotransferase